MHIAFQEELLIKYIVRDLYSTGAISPCSLATFTLTTLGFSIPLALASTYFPHFKTPRRLNQPLNADRTLKKYIIAYH